MHGRHISFYSLFDHKTKGQDEAQLQYALAIVEQSSIVPVRLRLKGLLRLGRPFSKSTIIYRSSRVIGVPGPGPNPFIDKPLGFHQ